MSGICGVVDFEKAVHQSALDRLVECVHYRGRARTWRDGPAGLIQLGTSPASALCRAGLTLVADARVDNTAELIASLAHWLPPGTSPSDEQLILASYRRWGTACAGRLVGDFAFALWDARKRRLFAARDAMGTRSLHYRVEPRRVIFATEVQQILALPDVPVRPFEPMVAAHLAGIFGPLEWTFYEGVSALPPAYALVVDASGHRTWRYWDIDPSVTIAGRDPAEPAERFREVFVEAVRCRMRQGKPAGILLSGGVDSGSAASTAGWLRRQEGSKLAPAFRAYCFAFSELSECDERHLSVEITGRYEIPVTEVPADGAWPLRDYPEGGPDRNEPFAAPYQVCLRAAFAAARDDQVTQLFSGARGDFVVGDDVFDELGLLRSRHVTAAAHDLRLHHQTTGGSWRRTMVGCLIRPALATLWSPARATRLRVRLAGDQVVLPPWMSQSFARRVGLPDRLTAGHPAAPVRNSARRRRYEHIQAFIASRASSWLEREHARFGLELAEPWGDRRLAELVLALPQWAVQRRGEPKRLALEAMKGIMPEPARQRACKITPEALFELGLRHRAVGATRALTKMSRAASLGWVDGDILREHYASYLQGDEISDYFWWAIMLEWWLRRYWE